MAAAAERAQQSAATRQAPRLGENAAPGTAACKDVSNDCSACWCMRTSIHRRPPAQEVRPTRLSSAPVRGRRVRAGMP